MMILTGEVVRGLRDGNPRHMSLLLDEGGLTRVREVEGQRSVDCSAVQDDRVMYLKVPFRYGRYTCAFHPLLTTSFDIVPGVRVEASASLARVYQSASSGTPGKIPSWQVSSLTVLPNQKGGQDPPRVTN
jgi:hypothetical protein